MKGKNRIIRLTLSMLLSICMVFTIVPSISWAATGQSGEQATTDKVVEENDSAESDVAPDVNVQNEESLSVQGDDEEDFVEDKVVGIEYIPHDTDGRNIHENTEGHMEGEGEDQYWYYEPNPDKGDKLTLIFEDEGEKKYSVTYTFNEDEEAFINEEDDYIYSDEVRLIDTTQSKTNQITKEEDHNKLNVNLVVYEYDEEDGKSLEAYPSYEINKTYTIIGNPVKSISINEGKDPVKLVEYTDGDWIEGEGEEDNWFCYDTCFDENDELTVTWDNNSSSEYQFVFSEYRDYFKTEDKNATFEKIYTDGKNYIDIDEGGQEDNHWKFNKDSQDADANIHGATVTFMGASTEKKYKLFENTVTGIKYTPATNPTVYQQYTHGGWEDNDTSITSDDWYYYYTDIDEGDKLTVSYKDGTSSTYKYYSADEDNGEFRNTSDPSKTIDREDVSVGDGNQWEKHWTYVKNKTNKYSVDIEYMGKTAVKTYQITANTVSKVEFNWNLAAKKVYENSNGYLEDPDEGETDSWFCYDTVFGEGDKFKVTWTDKTTSVYTYVNDQETGDEYFKKTSGKKGNAKVECYSDAGIDIDDGNQEEKHWTVGNTYSATVEFNGRFSAKKYEIVPNPVKDIAINKDKDPLTVYENSNGWIEEPDEEEGETEEWFYYDIGFDEGDLLTVTWSDDTETTYEYTWDENDTECFKTDDANAPFKKIDIYGDNAIEIDDGDQYGTHWKAGTQYDVNVEYLGKTTEKKYKVVENPVKNISFTSASEHKELYENFDGETDSFTKKFWYYTGFEEGDQLTVKWTDDSETTYEYARTDGHGYFEKQEGENAPEGFNKLSDEGRNCVNMFDNQLTEDDKGNIIVWKKGNTYKTTVEYLGAEVKDAKSFKIVPQTPSMYWLDQRDSDGSYNPALPSTTIESGGPYEFVINQVGGAGGASLTSSSKVKAWKVLGNSDVLRIESTPTVKNKSVSTLTAKVIAVHPGTASIRATLSNGKTYTAVVTVGNNRDISNFTITAASKEVKYNGAKIAPTFTVKEDTAKAPVLKSSNYNIRYYKDAECTEEVDPVLPGTYYAAAEGIEKNGYEKMTKTPASFKIVAGPQTVKPTLQIDNEGLVEGSLYVDSKGARNTGKIVVTPEAPITNQGKISNCTVPSAYKKYVEVKKVGDDWIVTPKKAGTVKINVLLEESKNNEGEPDGRCYATQGTLTIKILSVKAITYVELPKTTMVYDGTSKEYNKDDIIVKGSKKDKKSLNSDDFDLTYSKNVNAGTATVKVTVKPSCVSCTGSVSKTFTIAQKPQTLSAKMTCEYEREDEDKKIDVVNDNETAANTAFTMYLGQCKSDGVLNTAVLKMTHMDDPATNVGDIKVTTSDKNVVAVSTNGSAPYSYLLTAKKAGKATITVTAYGNDNPAYPKIYNYKKVTKKYTITVAKPGNITASMVTVAPSVVEYDGEEHKFEKENVTVKNANVIIKNYEVVPATLSDVGEKQITVKIAAADYGLKFDTTKENKVSVTVKMIPKKTSFLSLTPAKTKIAATWNKIDAVNGYQIQYSAKETMASATKVTVSGGNVTSRTISNLKSNKTYYIQIRTYKTVNKKTYYSNWSEKETVTTTK